MAATTEATMTAAQTATDALLGVRDIRQIAAQLDINPTKKLGQNFMVEPGTVRRIVKDAQVQPDDDVLEIGPGLGSLTLGLLEKGARVTAVELDSRLAEQLPTTVRKHGGPEFTDHLKVIHGDGLQVTPELLAEHGFIVPNRPFHLVANLPYNIATPLLLTLLERFTNLETAFVLVQKEVAERLSAKPGNKIYGAPSVKLAWYGTAKAAGNVSRSVFWPVPNVDSQLVDFVRDNPTENTGNAENASLRERTFQLIDAAFAQRRKTLRAALRGIVTAEQIDAAGIDPAARGETLTIGDFTRLAAFTPETATSETTTSLTTCTVTIPGKTNLHLRVGDTEQFQGRSMHKIETVYCSVGVSDTVTVKLKPEGTSFSLDIVGAHLGDLGGEHGSTTDLQDNLAVKALFAMAKESGRAPDVSISIEKNIPVAAGLGGGSADAAAVLLALDQLWNLHYPLEKLRRIAATLGADVPFCLTGELAFGSGCGEVVDELESALRTEIDDSGILSHMILGVFNSELSTAKVYSALKHPQQLVGQSRIHFSPSRIVNDLQEPCLKLFPRTELAIRVAQQTIDNPHNHEADGIEGSDPVALFVSGSGPTIVACSRNKAAINRIANAWVKSRTVDRILAVSAPAHIDIVCS
jgi:16S rRNA (adenine1518-N6/adenine1519-N6)-dimethyltransferase